MHTNTASKLTAITLIEREIAAISRSCTPDKNRATGLLDMAEVAGLLDETEIRYWHLQVKIAYCARQQKLRYGGASYFH